MLITDWNMPELNGYQLLEKIRGAPSLAGLPILMVTTVNDQESIITAVRAGVNNYLTKPFTPEQLKDKIDKALTHSVAQMAQEAADILQNGRQHSPCQMPPTSWVPWKDGTHHADGKERDGIRRHRRDDPRRRSRRPQSPARIVPGLRLRPRQRPHTNYRPNCV